MNCPLLFVAEIDAEELLSAQEQFFMSPHLKEVLIVSGSLFFAITLAVVGTIVYLKRKKHGRHHRRHSSYHSAQAQLAANAKTEASRKGGRRHRRSQRPMNPTLAETGGLPPLRNSKPSS